MTAGRVCLSDQASRELGLHYCYNNNNNTNIRNMIF
jgi:hypothetical protein